MYLQIDALNCSLVSKKVFNIGCRNDIPIAVPATVTYH